ncbi:MAG: hypothetical protein P8011_16230 [Acidihalobacter sp.]|uniref:hypothetical protein n=1 Tax=Acidihalobacter sp. TaxID=1872108 RepID=UPI00307EC0BB
MLLLAGLLAVTLQSCAVVSVKSYGARPATGSQKDFAIPGCEKAWNEIAMTDDLYDLRTLIKNNCSNLYREGWRLPVTGGNDIPDACGSAWTNLKRDNQLRNVKFMVTHNCPVFYRKGWTIPSK